MTTSSCGPSWIASSPSPHAHRTLFRSTALLANPRTLRSRCRSSDVELAADSLDPSAAYRLLVGIVVPRPIAWITTVSPAGLVNAAPFSCYTFVCNDPPMHAINIGRRDGELKDTARNIESGEFVVNVVSEDLVEAMHATS